MSNSLEHAQDYITESIGARTGDESEVVTAIPIDVNTDQYSCRKQHRNAVLLPVEKILPDPDQPRRTFDQTALNQLAESLKTKGQLQPVRVRWDEEKKSYFLLMGERRYRAAKIAELATLECVIHDEPLSEAEKLEIQLVENALREDLNPMETAEAYKILQEKKGCSLGDMATELSVNKSSISRSLSLLRLPVQMQKNVSSGKIPASVGNQLAKLQKDPAAQEDLYRRYLEDGITRDDARKAVQSTQGKGKGTGGTKKTLNHNGYRIVISHKRRQNNAEIAAMLQAISEELLADGRTKKSLEAA